MNCDIGHVVGMRAEWRWRKAYKPEEVEKSVKDRYIRVAAIDITISAGV